MTVRDFRCYDGMSIALGEGITVLAGPNGAGKTNLLEALYFGCTAYSCRTSNEREVVRFGAPAARVVVRTRIHGVDHELAVGFAPGQAKRVSVDGAAVERLLDAPERPLMSVFLPDRLELVKGVPALRRAHLDRFVGALWPARVTNRQAFARSLAQRNALLSRIRAGDSPTSALRAWDEQLAHGAVALMEDRALALERIAAPFRAVAAELGLDGEPLIGYRPRSRSRDVEGFIAELGERLEADLERGFTTHGPHRDDVTIRRGGRELRTYGSQGQQRLALLALVLAEREVLAEVRGAPPVLLLDDVMSELDEDRRSALIALIAGRGGQALITTTEFEHVPSADDPRVRRLRVQDGRVVAELRAA